MTTFLSIIDFLQSFATSHPQINTFYSGKTWNFESAENLYTAMVVLPVTSLIQKGDTEITFNIIICDIMNSDKTNKDDIYSDTLQIQQDLFATLNNADTDWFIDDAGFNCEPFEEQFDDILCGWISTINIKFPFIGNSCILPV